MGANVTSRRAVALVLAVFLLGIALGALGTYLAGARVWGGQTENKGPRDKRARFVQRLNRELDLTPDQQKQLVTILDETREQYRALQQQIAPQTDKVRQQSREKIRAILTPEQIPKFEDFLRRMDEERKKRNTR